MATQAQKRAAQRKTQQDETKIVLQVGSELRIKNNGDVTIDNPELELVGDDEAPTPSFSIASTPGQENTSFGSSSR